MLEGEIALMVPSLHYWEVGDVLRTYVVRGEMDAGLATEIFALHLEAPLAVREPERAEVLTAERTTTPWVVKLGRRVESVR